MTAVGVVEMVPLVLVGVEARSRECAKDLEKEPSRIKQGMLEMQLL